MPTITLYDPDRVSIAEYIELYFDEHKEGVIGQKRDGKLMYLCGDSMTKNEAQQIIYRIWAEAKINKGWAQVQVQKYLNGLRAKGQYHAEDQEPIDDETAKSMVSQLHREISDREAVAQMHRIADKMRSPDLSIDPITGEKRDDELDDWDYDEPHNIIRYGDM